MSKKKKPVVPDAQRALDQLRKEVMDGMSTPPQSLREEFKNRARRLVDAEGKEPTPGP